MIAGYRDQPPEHAITHDMFVCRAKFPSDQAEPRARLAAFGDRLRAHLPMTRLERVDLATGAVLAHVMAPCDPALVAWSKAHPDRWIAVGQDGGLRPG